jgi:hypothetical protein
MATEHKDLNADFDLTPDELCDESVVVREVPQIRVYINLCEEVGISILKMDIDHHMLDEQIVSIPVEYAKTVADAIVKVVEEHEENQ